MNRVFNNEMPWGHFFFLLTLWPVIEKIRDTVPNPTQHTWYLDDGLVEESEDQIQRTLVILANEGSKRGSVSEERQVRTLINRRSTLS